MLVLKFLLFQQRHLKKVHKLKEVNNLEIKRIPKKINNILVHQDEKTKAVTSEANANLLSSFEGESRTATPFSLSADEHPVSLNAPISEGNPETFWLLFKCFTSLQLLYPF